MEFSEETELIQELNKIEDKIKRILSRKTQKIDYVNAQNREALQLIETVRTDLLKVLTTSVEHKKN